MDKGDIAQDNSDLWLDSLTHATRTAIMTVNGYKKLLPNCEILWGFIHEACEFQGFGKDIFHIVNTIEKEDKNRRLQYPFTDRCFNKFYDWKPLQRLLEGDDSNDYKNLIGLREDGTIDRHPNYMGIEKIANTFIQGINV